MKTPALYTFVFVLLVAFACAPSHKTKPKTLQAFVGTWQQENTSTYEIWQEHSTFLSGSVIKIENADTLLLEHLKIVDDGNAVYYEATVPGQNAGKTIRFKLSAASYSSFCFENAEHDFPKKINYTFLNNNELSAIISGDNKQTTFKYRKIESINF